MTDERLQRKVNLLQVLSYCYNYGSTKHMVAIRLPVQKNSTKTKRKEKGKRKSLRNSCRPFSGPRNGLGETKANFIAGKTDILPDQVIVAVQLQGPNSTCIMCCRPVNSQGYFQLRTEALERAMTQPSKNGDQNTIYRATRGLKFPVRQTRDHFIISILCLFNRSKGLCDRRIL